jgi:hypothetical protein
MSFDKYIFINELYVNGYCSLEKLKEIGFQKEFDLFYIKSIGCYAESGSVHIDNTEIFF